MLSKLHFLKSFYYTFVHYDVILEVGFVNRLEYFFEEKVIFNLEVFYGTFRFVIK